MRSCRAEAGTINLSAFVNFIGNKSVALIFLNLEITIVISAVLLAGQRIRTAVGNIGGVGGDENSVFTHVAPAIN